MHKRRILYIPSWYPAPENKFKGSFFREQALLLNDHFDFFVITIAPKAGIIKLLYYYISRKKFYFDIQTPPHGFGIFYWQIGFPEIFSWIEPVKTIIEKINYKLMCKFSFHLIMKELNKLSWEPDFIHAQSVADGGIMANYLSFQLNIPYIITEHLVFLLQYFSAFKIKLIFKSFLEAKKVLAVSEHQKRQILMNGINCYPVVVGNLVDDSVFGINKKGTGIFTILVVTYPSYIKDNETFFNAIKLLKTNGITGFKILLIGSDLSNLDLKGRNNPLFKQAESFGIEEYVEILNYVNREEMPEYFNKSDVFVSTSIAETFGVAQCEAMMCGVPVIATSNGGIDDIISEKSGIKIPIKDYKALADAILKIKNKEVQFKPEEIRNSVINKFGRDGFKKKLLGVYNDV